MVLRLKDLEAIEAGKIRERSRELYRIPSLGIWTKLRPGIWSFLSRVSRRAQGHFLPRREVTSTHWEAQGSALFFLAGT